MVDGLLGVELLGVDQLLDLAEVHDREVRAEDIVEAALRNPHVERHLAALAPVDRDAGPALLALPAAPGGLALAGTDAASDAHAAFAGPFSVTKLVDIGIA